MDRILLKNPVYNKSTLFDALSFTTPIKESKFFLRKKLRTGRAGRENSRHIKKMEKWSSSELEAYQLRKLLDLLEFCKKRIPYYTESLQGIDPTGKSLSSVLESLPLINRKELYRANGQLFAGGIGRFLNIKTYTSGSTGSPVICRRSMAGIAREHSFIYRIWGWAGFRQWDRRVTIRGDLIVPASKTSPPYWFYNRWENQLIMSSYHLSGENLPIYLKKLREFAPLYIQGYPSSVYLLARCVLDSKKGNFPLKGIFTSSETITEEYREVITNAFRCKIFDYYGQAERCAMIGTCEEGTYHVFPEYGIVEFLPVPGEEGLTEITATGFIDRAMPLIRYRTGDYALFDKNDSCSCGRAYPVVKDIMGRDDDFILTLDGRKLGRIDHIFKGDFPVVEAQVIQYEPGEIEINLVPTEPFTSDHRSVLKEKCEIWLGCDMKITINEVSFIPRGRQGKFKAVISRLNPGKQAAGE